MAAALQGTDMIGIRIAKGVPAAIDQSCVGYWPLDEAAGPTACDYSANGYNGAATGCTFNQTGVFGKSVDISSAAQSGNRITVPNSIGTLTQGTLSLWCKFASLSGWQGIFSHNDAADGHFLFWYGDPSEGFACFVHAFHTVTVPVVGPWYHVALTWSSTTARSAYVNGRLEVSIGGGAYTFGNPLLIGKYSAASPTAYAFRGWVDDVRIYRRELKPAEIQALWINGGSGQ